MKVCEHIIENARVFGEDKTVKEKMAIVIDRGRIEDVLPVCEADGKYKAGEKTDGKNKLFLPGLIDCHMHTGQQLLKGGVLDAKPIIWTRIMLPFESTMTREKMRLSAGLAALEMIKSGTTGFVDAGSYYMEEAAEVYLQSGMRGALSCSVMDEPGLPESIAMNFREAVEQTDRLYDRYHKKGNLKVYYSLRALNSCSDSLMDLAAERAETRKTFLQAHMNEYQGEVDGIIKRTGLRPYEYLEKRGVLNERFLGAHSLLLSEEEIALIQKRNAKVCYCPFSNCGKAAPPAVRLLKEGITAGLGTDGAAHGGLSLWNEMKIFRSVVNLFYGVPSGNSRIMPAETILSMIWEGGAAFLGEEGKLGRIKTGYKADLISISVEDPVLFPTRNWINTLVESTGAGDVADMMVNGTWIMRNRQVLTLDEEKILWEAKKYMEDGMQEENKCFGWS